MVPPIDFELEATKRSDARPVALYCLVDRSDLCAIVEPEGFGEPSAVIDVDRGPFAGAADNKMSARFPGHYTKLLLQIFKEAEVSSLQRNEMLAMLDFA